MTAVYLLVFGASLSWSQNVIVEAVGHPLFGAQWDRELELAIQVWDLAFSQLKLWSDPFLSRVLLLLSKKAHKILL